MVDTCTVECPCGEVFIVTLKVSGWSLFVVSGASADVEPKGCPGCGQMIYATSKWSGRTYRSEVVGARRGTKVIDSEGAVRIC